MKITQKSIKIKDLAKGYLNSAEEGVVGYDGMLDIRPKYQREFVYSNAKRDKVIETIKKGFPINIMYWSVNSDTDFEVLDGQQRTISICEYVSGGFPVHDLYFHNLTEQEREALLNYEIHVYFCEGTEREKLEWFEIINIAGEQLTAQELRNAVYTGPWLTSAKRHFSKTDCVAYSIGDKYLTGSPIRQDYLETVINWISKGELLEYMAKHQHDADATELWDYFKNVMKWVQATFPTYRKEMKGIAWGALYNEYAKNSYNADALEADIKALMQDDDVTKRKGIYEYLLSHKTKEKCLSIRAFDEKTKRKTYEAQGGKCIKCASSFDMKDMEADHIEPWSSGGRTIQENCQMLCKPCNRAKSNK